MLEWPPRDGQRDHANGARERTQRTVALDPPALLEVLDALTAAEVDDRIRQAAQTIYPNPEALLRLVGAVLVEAHDEWQVSDRRYRSEGSMALVTAATKEVTPAQLMPA
jgi:Transposase, Mutator family